MELLATVLLASASDDSPDADVAALAIFGIFIMPIVGWITVRYLAHRERMEMIRHGINPPNKMRGRDWRDMAATSHAAGPMPGLERERIVLRKGIVLTFIGVALTIGLSFIGYSDSGSGPSLRPGPWLLGGLIPTFIGLAQVTGALLAGATFGYGAAREPYGFTAPPPLGEPFGAATPPPPARPAYDTSYTYRPGDTQELRPPPMPPERR